MKECNQQFASKLRWRWDVNAVNKSVIDGDTSQSSRPPNGLVPNASTGTPARKKTL